MVELQAQALSHELQTSVRGANLLTNPAPREVSPYVEQLLARLRSLQSSAAQVFPGETPRTLTLALTLTLTLPRTLILTLTLAPTLTRPSVTRSRSTMLCASLRSLDG